MPPVVATSIETLPLSRLRDLVAASTTFRSWTGTATEELAKERIYYVGINSGAGYTPPTRPFAIVSFQPEDGLSSERYATNGYGRTGEVLLMFQAEIDTEMDLGDQGLTFANTTGAIIQEIEDAAEQSFDIVGWTRVAGPYIGDENETTTEGSFAMVLYSIQYNDDGGGGG